MGNKDLGKDFQLEAQLKGALQVVSQEKLTWRVPISGLVPLSLACGSSLHDLILKEPQF